jgi:chaperonin GroES
MIRPLYDKIIVKRFEAQEKTDSGIIIPDTAKEKPYEGEIIAVGKGTVKEDGTLVPLEVKKGDLIIFGKYAGTEIKLDGEDYLMMQESDVFGIVEKVATRKKQKKATRKKQKK